jgi:hypothetical protein
MVRPRGRVTRFVVMAVLQAARAQYLGLPRDSAYSWGLNRAIFYAAAKRGFRGGNAPSGDASSATTDRTSRREPFRLGNEEAFRDPKSDPPLFTIGDSDQTVADFQRQIAARFGTDAHFQKAWEEAMRIVATYDRPTLESRRGFFDEVYKPRRDVLSEKWSREYGAAPEAK